MVAHGTIAFDTLTTSDQVKTGTEKSVDTSYLFNGVAKCWVNFNGSSTATIQDSFNITGLTDQGTGQYQFEITNDMVNSTFALPACTGNEDSSNAGVNRMHQTGTSAAGTFHFECANENDSNNDCSGGYVAVHGDLA